MNIQDRIDSDIDRFGRAIISVLPINDDERNDAFSYTIGNWLHHLPELVFIGSIEMADALNWLSRTMIVDRRPFAHGELVLLPGGKYPVCFLNAREDIKDDYTIQATHKIGRGSYRVIQVVGPDPNGVFPWEDGCERPYSDVFLYGSLNQRQREQFQRRRFDYGKQAGTA